MPSKGLSGAVVMTSNRVAGFFAGRGRRSSASARLKIALFAPMASASESTATATNAAACAARGVNSVGARWLCYRYLRRIAQSWIIAVCVSTINYLPTSLGRSRSYKITSVRRSRHTAGWCTRGTIVHCTISKK